MSQLVVSHSSLTWMDEHEMSRMSKGDRERTFEQNSTACVTSFEGTVGQPHRSLPCSSQELDGMNQHAQTHASQQRSVTMGRQFKKP